MLRSLQDLEGMAVEASDGAVGHVKDFYFDHHSWALRYLAVETGSWFASRQVLISPLTLGEADWAQHRLPVHASRAQVRDSPGIDLAQPISRAFELEHGQYYGYPYYWEGSAQWGGLAYPDGLYPGRPGSGREIQPTPADLEAEEEYRAAYARRHGWKDLHVRSFEEIRGFKVHASDGEIGTLDSVLVDDERWVVRYLVIATGPWWQVQHVQVEPQWIDRIDWSTSELFMGQSRQAVLDLPALPAALMPDSDRARSGLTASPDERPSPAATGGHRLPS